MRYFLLIIVSLFTQNAFSFSLSPEDMSYQRLEDRLGRLEKDLNFMQQQFYKQDLQHQNLSRKEVKTYPTLEVRIAEIEEQMRQLNGRLEEKDFSIRSIEQKLDKVIEDIDFRLSTMERNSDNVEKKAEKTEENKMPSELVGKMEKTTRESIAPLDAMGQYDKAFEFLRSADYEKAEVSLRDFITDNKESDLVSNAYYWLGETYFIRENYEKSAVNFLKGYQDRPKGNKAADNLLKLGMSLDRLNKKKEACTTFSKLIKEFPDADKSIKDKIESEKKRLECS